METIKSVIVLITAVIALTGAIIGLIAAGLNLQRARIERAKTSPDAAERDSAESTFSGRWLLKHLWTKDKTTLILMFIGIVLVPYLSVSIQGRVSNWVILYSIYVLPVFYATGALMLREAVHDHVRQTLKAEKPEISN